MRWIGLLVGLLLVVPKPASAAGDGAWISHLLSLPIPDNLTFCGESVPLDREDVLERLDLELVVTLGNPVSTTLWFKRIPRYFPLIEDTIRARGLPEDLKYVTLIESNLRVDAVSSAGATGPWQFMASTGSSCGLDRSSWRDSRRDWERATEAALDHLSDLREAFGSWAAALAAYNAGRSRVAQAMESQDQRDFYGLRLPRETERYVFRAMAAKLVVEHPEAYGITLEGSRVYRPVDSAELEVSVERRVLPVSALAAAAGVSYRRFLELNPWIVGSDLPRGTHRVALPDGSEGSFLVALQDWERANPEPKTTFHSVRSGDTLIGIARRYGVPLRDLMAWNDLNARSVIRPGQELAVHSVD